MKAPIPIRILRTVLALCVSFWMAGAGCMLGCSNAVLAAAQTSNSQTVIAGPSCHSSGHDCCAKNKHQATVSSDLQTAQETQSLFGTMPAEGMMTDCPLAVTANAVVASKATDNAPDQARQTSVELPDAQILGQQSDRVPRTVQFLNRGPTYLRCCVFLI